MTIEHTLALGPELTIAHAATAREALMDAWPPHGDLALDLSGVTDFDSAGVQLLLAARRGLTERGDALQLVSPSAVVADALAVFGLQGLFSGPASPQA